MKWYIQNILKDSKDASEKLTKVIKMAIKEESNAQFSEKDKPFNLRDKRMLSTTFGR